MLCAHEALRCHCSCSAAVHQQAFRALLTAFDATAATATATDNAAGGKNEDKTQGELKGMLKDLGYTADMVYKF
jgi:hypothetical protein